jgi:tetraprenyl-beta-curcumene synthase
MAPTVWPRLRLAIAFADFAFRYWLLAFPHARRAVERCMRSAAAVPDRSLRRAAIETLAEEQGNLEGAAAFAAFTPRRYRRVVIEALVSFQATFDYADTLAEQEVADPLANARALHQALLDSLTLPRTRHDYYAHSRSGRDGGYLDDLVSRCRHAFTSLPSHAAVERSLRRAVRRMIDYQTLIHGDGALAPISLATWAKDETPSGSGLRWWETAAAGASSLVAFALIAAAAHPSLSRREVKAIEEAYFPWYGSLHVLLDSLVDLPHDLDSGHHSLIKHYASPEETATRMEAIGAIAITSAQSLPNPQQHALFLTAMAGFYLAKPSARLPHAAGTTERLIATLGDLARPVLLVHQARSWIDNFRLPNRN